MQMVAHRVHMITACIRAGTYIVHASTTPLVATRTVSTSISNVVIEIAVTQVHAPRTDAGPHGSPIREWATSPGRFKVALTMLLRLLYSETHRTPPGHPKCHRALPHTHARTESDITCSKACNAYQRLQRLPATVHQSIEISPRLLVCCWLL